MRDYSRGSSVITGRITNVITVWNCRPIPSGLKPETSGGASVEHVGKQCTVLVARGRILAFGAGMSASTM